MVRRIALKLLAAGVLLAGAQTLSARPGYVYCCNNSLCIQQGWCGLCEYPSNDPNYEICIVYYQDGTLTCDCEPTP